MILLTGAKGQLGTSFQRLFNELGLNYISTDIDELNITSREEIKKFLFNKDIKIIINCAAYNDVDKAEKEQELCFSLNTNAPYYIASEAKEINAIFITFSTDFVFDGKKATPYTEEDKPNPLSIYGKSKLFGEIKVLEKYDRSYVIRTSWLFGKGKNFNTQILLWIKNRNSIKVVSDMISSPTFSDDLAYFTWKLVQTNKFGLYHFSNSGQASKYDQALYLLRKLDKNINIEKASINDFEIIAPRPSFSKLNSSKIEKIVKEKIPNWENGIDRWIENYLKKGELNGFF